MELLLDAIAEGDYDPACTRFEVALRALWLLYCRGKWDLLAETGLDQATFEPLFRGYGWEGRIRTDRQTLDFFRYISAAGKREAVQLLCAAIWLIGQYMTKRRRIRASYYGKQGDFDD